jgi:NitT/TauT family transport system ATP-binding protein
LLDEPFVSLDQPLARQMQRDLARLVESRRMISVLVTHDVEEAIVLGDRVCVLSPRPGRIVAELTVDLPRPRVATDPAVVALRAGALEALR